MFVNKIFLLAVSNPFYQAYLYSDFLGKVIFLSLIAISILSWTILIHKIFYTRQSKKNSLEFYKVFQKNPRNALNFEKKGSFRLKLPNPFYDLYQVLKRKTVEMLNKNRAFSKKKEDISYLSPTDVETVDSLLFSKTAFLVKNLEKNLFILSIIVGLSPLLGILGTVWGILNTFSELRAHAMASSNQMVLGGISLALTTTVLGILNAIPALIAYNYLKNYIGNFETEMDGFNSEMLASVEMQYRKVDLD